MKQIVKSFFKCNDDEFEYFIRDNQEILSYLNHKKYDLCFWLVKKSD